MVSRSKSRIWNCARNTNISMRWSPNYQPSLISTLLGMVCSHMPSGMSRTKWAAQSSTLISLIAVCSHSCTAPIIVPRTPTRSHSMCCGRLSKFKSMSVFIGTTWRGWRRSNLGLRACILGLTHQIRISRTRSSSSEFLICNMTLRFFKKLKSNMDSEALSSKTR